MVSFLCSQFTLQQGEIASNVVPRWVQEALVHSELFDSAVDLMAMLQSGYDSIARN